MEGQSVPRQTEVGVGVEGSSEDTEVGVEGLGEGTKVGDLLLGQIQHSGMLENVNRARTPSCEPKLQPPSQ